MTGRRGDPHPDLLRLPGLLPAERADRKARYSDPPLNLVRQLGHWWTPLRLQRPWACVFQWPLSCGVTVNHDRPMTGEEFGKLDALERRIQAGWDEAALALAEIKTAKLYRRTRDGQRRQTWEQYCQRVHQFTPQWANKLISRAKRLKEIREKTETEVSLSPTAVGQLEGLAPDLQVEIVQETTKGGQQPTAKQIGEPGERGQRQKMLAAGARRRTPTRKRMSARSPIPRTPRNRRTRAAGSGK